MSNPTQPWSDERMEQARKEQERLWNLPHWEGEHRAVYGSVYLNQLVAVFGPRGRPA
jgi:hypothetical protein